MPATPAYCRYRHPARGEGKAKRKRKKAKVKDLLQKGQPSTDPASVEARLRS
jgi:hypothetical protein